jgi:alkylhydroperoxidase/carboxymuconolactone decarboxylase family protein YurZ
MIAQKVSSALSPEALSKLRNTFDRGELEQLFVQVMGGRYDRTVDYVEEVHHLFHSKNPSDRRTTRSRLSEEDRERCTIAILAAKGEEENLAIHVYIALMIGISPEEIADVIFLAGIYAGVPAVTDGLDVEIRALEALEELVHPKTPEQTPTNGSTAKTKGKGKASKSPKGGTRGPQEPLPQPPKPNVMAAFVALQSKFRGTKPAGQP